MIRTTLRGLVAHKLRLATTALAVLIGVAFMSGTLVLTDTLGQQFDSLVADAHAGTDVQVRREAAFTGESGPTGGGTEVRDRIDASLLAAVAQVDGVAAVTGRTEGWAQLVAADGETVGGGANSAPTQGVNWVEQPELNPYRLVEGDAPRADDEVVIDRASARTGELAVGDSTTVLVKGGPTEVTISGIATFGDVDSMLGVSTVLFTDAAAQRLVGEPGRYDGISVLAQDGVAPVELTDRVAAALPDGVEALTGDELRAEQQSEAEENLAFFNVFMITFAVVALFVGSFIIFNTFSIIVAQRGRELAVLRAIGASRRQVLSSVLLESLVVGVLSSAVGLAAGIGVAGLLRSLIEAVGIEVPASDLVVAPASMVTALVVGVVITVASAVLPARRAARIAPVAAMRESAVDSSAGSTARIASGAVATAAGAALLAAGLAGVGSAPVALVGAGATVVFLGVAVLGPVLARPVSGVIGAPIARLRGVPGTLARQNAARSPKRTAATASALMIGVALVGFISIMASSTRASVDEAVSGMLRAELVVESGSMGDGGFDPSLTAEIAELPEVGAVTGFRMAPATVDGTAGTLVGTDSAVMDEIFDVDMVDGSLADLGRDGLVVTESVADENGWTVGDEVELGFADGATERMVVRGVHDSTSLGDHLVDTQVLEAHGGDPFDLALYVLLTDGVDVAEGRAAVTSATADLPNAEVQDRSEFTEAQAATLDPLLGLVYALLGLAVLIAVLGIANTLALSIFERTRELGLLRAVGMSRSQMRTSVRWESVIIALLGTTLGLAIGVGFGWAIVTALAGEGLTTLVVPFSTLGVVALLAVVAGVVAAALPARRAARLDVLGALQG